MKNPKIRIESDGEFTELYIDGKLIDRPTRVDVNARPHVLDVMYHEHMEDEYGPIINEKNELCEMIHQISFDHGVERRFKYYQK